MPKNAISKTLESKKSTDMSINNSIVEKQKPKMGRPEKPLDYNQLIELCKMQATYEEVCAVLNYSEDALRVRLKKDHGLTFKGFYQKYAAEGRYSLRRAQMKNALNGNTQMQIWLGKQILGQKDAMNIDSKQEKTLKLDFSAFDDEAREYIRQALLAAEVKEMKTIEGEVLDE